MKRVINNKTKKQVISQLALNSTLFIVDISALFIVGLSELPK